MSSQNQCWIGLGFFLSETKVFVNGGINIKQGCKFVDSDFL